MELRRKAANEHQRVTELPQKLVADYIQTVYKDYGIADPLAPINLPVPIRQHNRRRSSLSTNRKAVQLKESFLI